MKRRSVISSRGIDKSPAHAEVPNRALMVHASRFTHHASRITHHASRFTHHASRFTHHVSRFTHHVSRITFHASCFAFRRQDKCQIFQCRFLIIFTIF
ncbi:hypothetical protein QUF80_02330 [Desulfococcaceae bacterium HSG8]|nr:hypothetical protein [Desulfococcaceae bacterium HSG8]